MNLVLASGSPRRRDLLRASGYVIAEISPSHIPEQRRPDEDPKEYTARLAHHKALDQARPNAWVLGADTVVHLQSKVLEKPKDDTDARSMLRLLSGNWHWVTTSWSLVHATASAPMIHSGQCTSSVLFRALLPAEIAAYVASGEGRDKAGAYGIQGLGAALVAEVQGSYSNVVGLPMEQIAPILQSLQFQPQGVF